MSLRIQTSFGPDDEVMAILMNPSMTFKHGPLTFRAFVSEEAYFDVTVKNGSEFLLKTAGICASINEIHGRAIIIRRTGGNAAEFVRFANI